MNWKDVDKSSAIGLLEYANQLPVIIDAATVPKAGISAAPEQVVGNISVPWLWIKSVRELVESMNQEVHRE